MKWTCNPYAEMLIERAEAKRTAGKADPPPVQTTTTEPPAEPEFSTAALLKILNE